MLFKAWTKRGLVYSARGRIFNNMLYVRYVHMTKGQACSWETNLSSRQRGCCIRTMTVTVQLQKIISSWASGLGAKTNWFAANCQSQSNSNSEIPLVWKPNVHYHVHKSPSLVPILNKINPVHSLHLVSARSNLILPPSIPRSSKWSVPVSLFQQQVTPKLGTCLPDYWHHIPGGTEICSNHS
jgi:hypothetical protein